MKNMEIQFVIVRSENREYLCYKAEDVYVDVSNPMMTFTDGEDVFETVEPDCSLMRKEYEFKGERFYLVPRLYGNGWRSRWQAWEMNRSISCCPSIWRKWTHSVCPTAHSWM